MLSSRLLPPCYNSVSGSSSPCTLTLRFWASISWICGELGLGGSLGLGLVGETTGEAVVLVVVVVTTGDVGVFRGELNNGGVFLGDVNGDVTGDDVDLGDTLLYPLSTLKLCGGVGDFWGLGVLGSDTLDIESTGLAAVGWSLQGGDVLEAAVVKFLVSSCCCCWRPPGDRWESSSRVWVTTVTSSTTLIRPRLGLSRARFLTGLSASSPPDGLVTPVSGDVVEITVGGVASVDELAEEELSTLAWRMASSRSGS